METHDGAQTTTEQVTGGPAEDAGLDTKCVFCKQDVSETSEPQLLPCLHTACKLCIPTDPTGENLKRGDKRALLDKRVFEIPRVEGSSWTPDRCLYQLDNVQNVLTLYLPDFLEV
ncbi:hypothetical protein HPB49_002370 [Dermacentor silvarum]|uniref:Uncharacterized protein n=1 Tax=Dermacentor silvarum TaxID=543639 RepID=A0ACB8CUN9_DERSI|nr:hypothetical protein HPB49_002370 [Dermacentor silvarum]